jgi:hypothetical protein
MTLSSHQACLQYLAEQHRSPSSSSTHSCFREFENESYLQDGLSFAVKVFDRDKAVQFVDYHWNLSTLLKQSREVGFRLLALTELPDAPGGNPRGAPCSALNASQRVTLTVPHQ